jgi:hypothetical protein
MQNEHWLSDEVPLEEQRLSMNCPRRLCLVHLPTRRGIPARFSESAVVVAVETLATNIGSVFSYWVDVYVDP